MSDSLISRSLIRMDGTADGFTENAEDCAFSSYPGLAELSAALRSGELSAASQVSALEQRLDGLSAPEHGFSHLDLESAYLAAHRADQIPLQQRGRFHGLLIPIKDLSDVAGMPTTNGSARRTYTPVVSDPLVEELIAHGAIIPGKSAAAELGLTIYTEPPGMEHPVNPLWPGRTPAGSSGGAAVLVAHGILPAAHASDGGGSIRVPAAVCGVVGMKPSAPRLAAQGFITRSLADAAFLYGHDLQPVEGQRPARIGILLDPLFIKSEVDEVMLLAVSQAAEQLREAGHEVVQVSPYPGAEDTFQAFTTIFTSKLARLPGDAEGIVDWLRAHGRAQSREKLNQAEHHADRLGRQLAQHWGVDALLTPMTTTDPPPIGYFSSLSPQENFLEQTRWSPWGSLFNMTGQAAISLPWPAPGRPPVGVHLGSITLNDAELIRLAMELHP